MGEMVIVAISNKANGDYHMITMLLQNTIVTTQNESLRKFERVTVLQNIFATS